MEDGSLNTITLLLTQAREGDAKSKERLFHLVRDELHAIAEKQMRGERADHSLQATVLIDDAFLRLVSGDADISWQNRKHFYRTAANAMRQMLIDHERQRRAQRRGGGEHRRIAVDPDMLGDRNLQFDILALDEALTKLAEIDPRQSEIVELHHFGGCSLKETADLLGISLTTAKAEWKTAKAWLHRELTPHSNAS